MSESSSGEQSAAALWPRMHRVEYPWGWRYEPIDRSVPPLDPMEPPSDRSEAANARRLAWFTDAELLAEMDRRGLAVNS